MNKLAVSEQFETEHWPIDQLLVDKLWVNELVVGESTFHCSIRSAPRKKNYFSSSFMSVDFSTEPDSVSLFYTTKMFLDFFGGLNYKTDIQL